MSKIHIDLPDLQEGATWPEAWPKTCPYCDSKGTQLNGYDNMVFEFPCGGSYCRNTPYTPCGNPKPEFVMMVLADIIGDQLDEEGVPRDYTFNGYDESLVVAGSFWRDCQEDSPWEIKEVDEDRVKIRCSYIPEREMTVIKDFFVRHFIPEGE
jgi:hypothetical protein